MSDIEWTDVTWNPVVGCTRVSAGCDHCYAMGVAHRKMSPQHVGLTKLRPKDAKRPGIDWTGEVRFLPDRLAEPLHWRKPRRVFVNSMSDLFHERVTDEQIAAVFGVMAACPQHTFQVLTKRPERASEFFVWAEREGAKHDLIRDGMPDALVECAWAACCSAAGDNRDGFSLPTAATFGRAWPLPNVHLGVSVEDQATADERIPLLLQCPAAVRWVSYEPALGPVDFKLPRACKATIGWIVVGGESGPGARPFDLAWARSTIDQCRDAGVPVFVKQLGAMPFSREPQYPPGWMDLLTLRDRKGGDMAEWPKDLQVREWPR